MRTAEQLGWYRFLAHNTTIAGSLFTLLHLPFMIAFASLVVIGTLPLSSNDPMILLLSMAAVVLVLYGEHMLDDTVMVGKPWGTVFNDRSLIGLAVALFVAALMAGAWASFYLGSALPFVGVAMGISFSVLYGLEVWSFHSVLFGSIGMGAIPVFAYIAQSLALHIVPDILSSAALFAVGAIYGYAMLGTYERTKVDHASWTLLGLIFLVGYSVALLALLRPFL